MEDVIDHSHNPLRSFLDALASHASQHETHSISHNFKLGAPALPPSASQASQTYPT